MQGSNERFFTKNFISDALSSQIQKNLWVSYKDSAKIIFLKFKTSGYIVNFVKSRLCYHKWNQDFHNMILFSVMSRGFVHNKMDRPHDHLLLTLDEYYNRTYTHITVWDKNSNNFHTCLVILCWIFIQDFASVFKFGIHINFQKSVTIKWSSTDSHAWEVHHAIVSGSTFTRESRCQLTVFREIHAWWFCVGW